MPVHRKRVCTSASILMLLGSTVFGHSSNSCIFLCRNPLEQFKTGDVVTAWVLGVHDAKTHRFLAISQANRTRAVLELSLREVCVFHALKQIFNLFGDYYLMDDYFPHLYFFISPYEGNSFLSWLNTVVFICTYCFSYLLSSLRNAESQRRVRDENARQALCRGRMYRYVDFNQEV